MPTSVPPERKDSVPMSGNAANNATAVQCNPKEMFFRSLAQNERQRSSLTLSNPTGQRYAFKVKTTSPKSYVVKPSVGFLEPDSSFKITIIKQRNPKPAVSDKFMIEVMATNERSLNPSDTRLGPGNKVQAIRLIKVPVNLEAEAGSSAENSESVSKPAMPPTMPAANLQPEESFTPTPPPPAVVQSPSRMSPSFNEEIRPSTAARDGLVCMNNDLTFRYNSGASVISTIRLYNPTEDRYAFKVRNTFPKGFKVKPPQGFLKPRTAIDVEVILLQNSRGMDFSFAKFLIQSFVVDFTDEVITEAMYHKAKLYKAVRETELDVKLVGFDERPESQASGAEQERSAAAAYEIRYLRKQLIHMESELNSLKQQIKHQNTAPIHIHQDSSANGVKGVGCMKGRPFSRSFFRFRRQRRSKKLN